MNIQCHTDVPPNCVPVSRAVASIASSLCQQRLAPREIAALPTRSTRFRSESNNPAFRGRWKVATGSMRFSAGEFG